MNGLVLSVFPGIDLLGRAFEEEGYCVVRGPDVIWGGDVRTFHPPAGMFEGVIGGPPCGAFSRLRHIVKQNGYKPRFGNLIPEFERVVAEAQPRWFLMENVAEAPLPSVPHYSVYSVAFKDVHVGGLTDRLRVFSFGTSDGSHWRLTVDFVALHPQPEHSALASGAGRPVPVAIGGSGKVKRSERSALKNYDYKTNASLCDHLRKQGLPEDFLADSPFTVAGKVSAVGNGVPMAMGRAIAKAVRRAVN